MVYSFDLVVVVFFFLLWMQSLFCGVGLGGVGGIYMLNARGIVIFYLHFDFPLMRIYVCWILLGLFLSN